MISEPIEKVKSKKLFIESYGCQMNFSDSEIVASVLQASGYEKELKIENADLILFNTCSIREKAEQTIRKRLQSIQKLKRKNPSLKIGVLGCMAERLKDKFLEEEKIVDLVVGPDAYRDLPKILEEVGSGHQAVNVQLSKEETYGDLQPVRLDTAGIKALVTITRGCDNMCTFCVVPFTRGRERSRDPHSIVEEIRDLDQKGYKEITLLGQNVDSYLWYGGGPKKDFEKATDLQKISAVNFSSLLRMVAIEFPNLRIRFSTNNPQDMDLEVLHIMANYNNVCKHIHLPVQSGSTSVLNRMNRQHTREEYISLIDKIREIVPECSISYDIITGFCGETEEEHKETLSLLEYVQYEFGYLYAYSDRPGTPAHKKLEDDIPQETKQRRLTEIIDLQYQHSLFRMKKMLGKTVSVLIEGDSKKSKNDWCGRTSQNTMVVFPKANHNISAGIEVNVKIKDCTKATLFGELI